jgi:ATP-dependent exoDNAse (exonuclease V) alpha subunit
VAEAIALLEQQGRITEIKDASQRIASIARSYAESPENTIVVSPDNASRREINQAVRTELQTHGIVDTENHMMCVLVLRSDMTGADRTWAANYDVGDVLHYQRGSKAIGIEKQSYATVVAVQPKENLLTMQTENGKQVTYDPARLLGISGYRELEREFAVGDRVQLTAPNRDLQVANRDLATVKSFDGDGRITLRMDSGKDVSFNTKEMRHFDHGYAVTSHSSQGLTSQRILVNMDTEVHPELINARFAYVSVSRASYDAQVFTNDVSSLAERLSAEVSKTSALEFGKMNSIVPKLTADQSQAVTRTNGAGFGLAL